MGVVGADAVVAVLLKDVVFDINAIQGLPQDDAVSAVECHDVVVDLEITNGRVACDLKAAGGVGKQDVVSDHLILATEV